eukprot:jgi/Chrpa1/128/Chrysochromulina_OHIO_Genome00009928-RA
MVGFLNTTNSSNLNAGGRPSNDISAILVYSGIALEVVAGALLSLSMVIQRHALTYKNDVAATKVPLLCCRMGRWKAWFVGLVVYGAASCIKVVGFNLGPLTILGSVFVGALLVVNLFLGHWLLKEELTHSKVVGTLLVLAGACVSSAGTPTGAPTSFSTTDMQALFMRAPPFGGFYLALVILVVLLSLWFILVIEKAYPVPRLQAAQQTRAAAAGSLPFRLYKRPSFCLAVTMVLVYPGSLGLNEAFADICVKAYSSMLVRCITMDERGLPACHDWTLYVTMGVGIPSAISTSYWLKVVFERYQTTLALPIEYSTLNIFSVIGGLLFFQEVDYMTDQQRTLALVGCLIMTIGGAVIVAGEVSEELLASRRTSSAGTSSADTSSGEVSPSRSRPGSPASQSKGGDADDAHDGAEADGSIDAFASDDASASDDDDASAGRGEASTE